MLSIKKYKCMAVFIPSLTISLICIASPLSVVRYMLPVLCVTPINIAWIIYNLNKDKEGAAYE